MTYLIEYQDLARMTHIFKSFTNKKKAQHVIELFKKHGRIAWLAIVEKAK